MELDQKLLDSFSYFSKVIFYQIELKFVFFCIYLISKSFTSEPTSNQSHRKKS